MSMVQPPPPRSYTRLAMAARMFGALTLLALAGIEQNFRASAVLVAALVTVVAMVSIFTMHGFPRSHFVVPLAEATVVTLLASAVLHQTQNGFAYVVVPVFVAGLVGGATLMGLTWLTVLLVAAGGIALFGHVGFVEALGSVLPWLMTSAAAGWLATWVRYTAGQILPEADAYDAAHRLLSSREGIFVEPASAAGVAGLLKVHAAGDLRSGLTVVCTVTGHGLKDPQWALRTADGSEVVPVRVPVDAVSAAGALGLDG